MQRRVPEVSADEHSSAQVAVVESRAAKIGTSEVGVRGQS
jgi:hypothetical protein